MSGVYVCACGPSVRPVAKWIPYPRSTEAIKNANCPRLPAARCFRSCAGLWPYIFGRRAPDLIARRRGDAAPLAAKLVTIAVPSLPSRGPNDALNGRGGLAGAPSAWLCLGAHRGPDRDDHCLRRDAAFLIRCFTRLRDGSSPRIRHETRYGVSPTHLLRAHAQLSLRFHLDPRRA